MVRSIVAIVVGFFLVGALSVGADVALMKALPSAFSSTGRVDSTPVLLLIIGYVFVFAVTGCYVAARLAPRRPMLHALILGVLGLLFNIIGTAAKWQTAPAWYHIVSLLLVLPAAWLGGKLGEAQLQRANAV